MERVERSAVFGFDLAWRDPEQLSNLINTPLLAVKCPQDRALAHWKQPQRRGHAFR